MSHQRVARVLGVATVGIAACARHPAPASPTVLPDVSGHTALLIDHVGADPGAVAAGGAAHRAVAGSRHGLLRPARR